MPNNVTNYVEIKGSTEKVAQLVERTIKLQDGLAEFDFNGIIPMPQELKETISPTEFVPTREEADRKNRESQARNLMYDEGKVRFISQAEADRRAELYGDDNGNSFNPQPVLNWYDWAKKNWGTKWGAYDVSIIKQEDSRLVLQFDTAWNCPTTIFDDLVADGFEVNCFWQDEDESNYGEYGEPWGVFNKHIEYDFIG